MKILIILLILVNSLFAEELTRGEIKSIKCNSEEMTTCTEVFLLQDQLFIDKYGGNGKKSVRSTVKLKN